MLLKWKDSFSCNITEIDNQHKNLFKLGSDLNNILMLRDGIDRYDELLAIFNELKDYTIYHFDYEEKLLEQQGYEHLDSHKLEHRGFINKVNEILNADIDENQSRITMDVFVFVADWIANHILKTDMRYKDFMNSKGIY